MYEVHGRQYVDAIWSGVVLEYRLQYFKTVRSTPIRQPIHPLNGDLDRELRTTRSNHLLRALCVCVRTFYIEGCSHNHIASSQIRMGRSVYACVCRDRSR